MQNQSVGFFKHGPSKKTIENTILSNESIVAPCSSGISSTDQQCFTNSACYLESPVSKATGQLQWHNLSTSSYAQNVSGQRWGTAFFISPNLIMTAGHCFDVATGDKNWITPNINGAFLTPQQLAPMIKLNMDYQYQSCWPSFNTISPIHEVSFKIKKLVEYRTAGLDYAIAEVEDSPGNSYGFVKFDFTFTAGNIFIVQHPEGAPKKLEVGYGTVSTDKQMIKHNVNTLGGSSGSCVTNYNNDRGCGVHIQGDDGTGMNSALYINYVRQKSPIINGFFRLQKPTIFKQPSLGAQLSLPKEEQSNEGLLWGLGLVSVGAMVAGGGLCLTSKNKTVKNIGVASMAASIILGIIVIMLIQAQNQNKGDDKNESVYGTPNFTF